MHIDHLYIISGERFIQINPLPIVKSGYLLADHIIFNTISSLAMCLQVQINKLIYLTYKFFARMSIVNGSCDLLKTSLLEKLLFLKYMNSNLGR